MIWGAGRRAWLHFDLVLGLGEDLLPVVSYPDAEISPNSTLKGLGKTPSVYNRNDFATGISKWTDIHASPAQIDAWSKEDDYGVCLQTRSVRGLDVDVAEPGLSAAIVDCFLEALGRGDGAVLPIRKRANSGKQLCAFTLPGDLGKRSFPVEGGLVEFLATGQQFIACGTHPSGARYEWAGGLPDEFPTISLDDFERAWAAIVAKFAIADERRSGAVARRRGETVDVDDPVAGWLQEHWTTYGVDGGKLLVGCPWRDGHSVDSGETETVWFLAGSGGYVQGHFECLHASCSGRSDTDFLEASGYAYAQFDDLGPLPRPQGEGGQEIAELPTFARDKSGGILATIANVRMAADNPMCGFDIKLDTFRRAAMVGPPGMERWRTLGDTDITRLRIHLENRGFKPISNEMMRQAVDMVAEENQFDAAIKWIGQLPEWDGVRRAERFFPDYFGTADTPYTRACGLYAWSAHAGRVLAGGCKVDMVPVLVGPQGQRKSAGVAAIAPYREWFAELTMDMKDDDLSRMIRGKLVAEIAELRGLNSKAIEGIKAWVTKQVEEWIPKFKEHAITYGRRFLAYGTTNEDEFLADPTGERRWLPMRVEGDVDDTAIARDREQLWAEGVALWRAEGILWQDAERLAKGEHEKYRITDEWEHPVERWLAEPDLDGRAANSLGEVLVSDVLQHALDIAPKAQDKRAEMRVSKILRMSGWSRVQKRVDGRKMRVWVK